MDETSEVVSLLRDVRYYLEILAEPLLREKERTARQRLYDIAGKSEKRRAALRLMTGTMTRPEITKETGIDPAEMSRLMKTLQVENLIVDDGRCPRLIIRSTASLFED